MSRSALVIPKPLAGRRSGISFELALSGIFVVSLLVLSTVLIWLQSSRSEAIVSAAAVAHMSEMAKDAQEKASSELTGPTVAVVQTLSGLPTFTATSTPSPESWLILVNALNQLPLLNNLFIGYDDGNYLEVASTRRGSTFAARLTPPPGSAFRVGQIYTVDGQRWEDFLFLDEEGTVIERRPPETDLTYDPRLRPWYVDATTPGAKLFTAPYLFASGSLGYTARVPLRGGHGVVATDVLLVQLQQFVRAEHIGRSGGMVLFDDHQHVIAGPGLTSAGQDKLQAGQELPIVSDLADPAFAAAVQLGMAGDSEHLTFTTNGREYIGAFHRLDLDVQGGISAAVVAPTDEFFGEVVELRRDAILLALLVVLAAMPIVLTLSRVLSGGLRRLAAQAEERSQLILGSIEEGICGLDLEGRVSFVNPAGARMLGYEPEMLIGKQMHEHVHYAHADGSPFPIEECPVRMTGVDGEARKTLDDTLWRRNGEGFPAELNATPVYRDGTLDSVVVAYRDITERKRGTEAIQTARDSAEHANIQLDEKNQMLQLLSSKLSRYLSPQVYESIFRGAQEVSLETRRKKLTIFASELRDFSQVTEDMQAEDSAELLNDYFAAMAEVALEHGATIDKFIGAAILMFFGDPETRGVEEDAKACVRMAVAMQHRMEDFRATWHVKGVRSSLQVAIGVNTGFCNVGNFGSSELMSYTIVGAEVSLAQQLEDAAEPNTILMSYETYALVSDTVQATELPSFLARGIRRPVRPFSVTDASAARREDHDVVEQSTPGFLLSLDLHRVRGTEQPAAIGAIQHALATLKSRNRP